MITATHINYLLVCHRKLWLFHHGIRMEHSSEQVYEGKLTGELSYQRRSDSYTELSLETARIDYYDAREKVVHEVKHSSKIEEAHIAQIKYYIYLLRKENMDVQKGRLEYPRLRTTETVHWEDQDEAMVENLIKKCKTIISTETAPEVIHSRICKSCSYYDFCYSGE